MVSEGGRFMRSHVSRTCKSNISVNESSLVSASIQFTVLSEYGDNDKEATSKLEHGLD